MSNDNMRDSGIEWIGEIPAEWDVTLLGSVFHQHQHKNVGLIEQNLLSLSYGRIVRKNMKTNDGLKPGSYETYNVINADDIVCRFTDLQNDQRSLRNAISTERGIVTSAYLTIRSNDADDIDSRYINYLLRDYDIKKVFYGLGAGVRQSLKWSEFRKLPLILPPLPEQRRIAAYLDSRVSRIDRLVDGLSRRVELLDEYKKSLISETVTKGIRQHENMKDSGIEWVGEIPAEWDVAKLKYFASAKAGKNLTAEDIVFDENSIPVYGGNGLRGYYNKANNFENRILIGRQGALCGNVHFVQAPFWATDHALVVTLNKNYSYGYFHYTLSAANLNRLSMASAQPGLSAACVLNEFLPVPPLPEQREIAAFLDERVSVIDRLMDACRKQIDSLGEYKKSLISECVTGKRRITDADLEGVPVA